MQPIENVVFNLFNLDPDNTNLRLPQGRDQLNRRVRENKDAMPSTLRDVPSTSSHKTGGWISSLNLGNIKPVLFATAMVNQFSPLFGRAHSAEPAAWLSSWLSAPGLPDIVDNCSSATVKEMAGAVIEKIMTTANCSAEAASEILKSMMEPAEDCDSYTHLQMLGIGAAAGIGGLLIGGVFTYKCIPAIKERLCSDNDVHPPVETPRNDEPEISMTEKDPMLHKGSDEKHPIPPDSPAAEFDDPGMLSGCTLMHTDNLKLPIRESQKTQSDDSGIPSGYTPVHVDNLKHPIFS